MTEAIYPVIGMSPGNSYFKDEEVRYLLKTVVERYGKTAVFIADIPAISTYIAFGYPENRARRDKAIPQGNALKNRTNKMREELDYSTDQVHILDWSSEIEENLAYQERFKAIRSLYETNKEFQQSADDTTRDVLISSGRKIEDIEKAIKIAVHYLLSEFAFLEFAPDFFGVSKVGYVYHKNWPVYEDYIAGKFDGILRDKLDFILLENPYETYNPMWGSEEDESVLKTKVLRAGFSSYDPAFLYDRAEQTFSGVFFDVITRMADEEGWRIVWTEEIGYGVVQEGLKNNRFELFAGTVWATPEREKEALFSESLYESPTFVWAKEGNRYSSFSESRGDLHIRIAIKEGDISDSIARADFPNARLIRVPQLASPDELLRFVAKGKADLTFVEPYLADLFNQKSDTKVVRVEDAPIRRYSNAFMLAKDNSVLKEFLDKKIKQYKQEGYIEVLIEKYTGSKKTFSLS